MAGKRDLKKEFEELRRERAEREARGVLPRAIERQHKFPPNERPDDPDADPASGWLYANKGWEVVAPPPAGPTVDIGYGGADSGMDCFRGGCNQRLRIIDEFAPGDILSYMDGNEEKRVVVKGDVNILFLACSLGHKAQFRSDMLPNRTRLILP